MTDWRRTKATSSDGDPRALLGFVDRPRTGEEIAAFADAWVDEHPDAIAAEEIEHQRTYKWRPLVRWSALTRVPEDGTWRRRRRWSWSPRPTSTRPRTRSPRSSLATCAPSGRPRPRTSRAGSAGACRPSARRCSRRPGGGRRRLYDLPGAPAARRTRRRRRASSPPSTPPCSPTRQAPHAARPRRAARPRLPAQEPPGQADVPGRRVRGRHLVVEVKRREATLTLTGSPDRSDPRRGREARALGPPGRQGAPRGRGLVRRRITRAPRSGARSGRRPATRRGGSRHGGVRPPGRTRRVRTALLPAPLMPITSASTRCMPCTSNSRSQSSRTVESASPRLCTAGSSISVRISAIRERRLTNSQRTPPAKAPAASITSNSPESAASAAGSVSAASHASVRAISGRRARAVRASRSAAWRVGACRGVLVHPRRNKPTTAEAPGAQRRTCAIRPQMRKTCSCHHIRDEARHAHS